MDSGVLKNIAIGFLCWVSLAGYSQDALQTERPTNSTSSYTLTKNTFQFEQGFAFWNDTTLLDGLFRIAVSERAEIRIFTNYGKNSTYWGAKVNLWKQNGYYPGISLQASLGSEFTVVNYRVSLSQKVTDKIGATFNVGKADEYYTALALGYGLTNSIGVFIEGYYQNAFFQFNAGATFLLGTETQLDLSGGLLTNNQYFAALGISRRFLYKNKE